MKSIVSLQKIGTNMSDAAYYKAFEYYGQMIASGELHPTHKTADYLQKHFDYSVLLSMMVAIEIKKHWQQVIENIDNIPF